MVIRVPLPGGGGWLVFWYEKSPQHNLGGCVVSVFCVLPLSAGGAEDDGLFFSSAGVALSVGGAEVVGVVLVLWVGGDG